MNQSAKTRNICGLWVQSREGVSLDLPRENSLHYQSSINWHKFYAAAYSYRGTFGWRVNDQKSLEMENYTFRLSIYILTDYHRLMWSDKWKQPQTNKISRMAIHINETLCILFKKICLLYSSTQRYTHLLDSNMLFIHGVHREKMYVRIGVCYWGIQGPQWRRWFFLFLNDIV